MAVPNIFAPNTKILSALVNANFAYLEAEIAATNVVVALLTTTVAGKLTAANNLSDLANVVTARSNLGLGSAALVATGTSAATLGLLNANKTDSGNNTYSGANTVSGSLAVPTQAPGNSTTQAASTAFVAAALATALGGTVTRSYLAGLTMSTAGSSATYGVAAGVAADSTNVSSMVLASAFTKTTSAWAVGTGNGSLDTGAVANSTWYHVYLIQRLDTGLVDVICSLSATAPTLPTNYTLFRRIGAMKTNSSAQWTLFTQNGDEFLWAVPVNDISTSTQSTTAILYVVTVPTGIAVNVLGVGSIENGSAAAVLLSSPATTDTAPTGTGVGWTITAGIFSPISYNTRTNTSAQIRVRSSAASTSVFGTTQGWLDRRGRDN